MWAIDKTNHYFCNGSVCPNLSKTDSRFIFVNVEESLKPWVFLFIGLCSSLKKSSIEEIILTGLSFYVF